MDWAMILVIILAAFLALFLALAIALTVILIKISRQIKNITATAERTALKFEDAAAGAAKFAAPIAIAKLVKTFIGKK